MFSLKQSIVFVTGASSGIGRACVFAFAAAGADVIVAARRRNRLESLAREINEQYNTRVHIVELDVRHRENVTEALAGLPDSWREIGILVNNAGLARGLDKFHEADVSNWEEMIDTNIKGLLYVSRTVIPGMLERGRGHIINIGSIAGQEAYPRGGVYNASKFAVDAVTKSLRMDLVDTPLRVSTVDPGLVETEFSLVRFQGDAARAGTVYEGFTPCAAEDVADAVLYCATRPAHVSINQIVLMPTAQASAQVLHRGGGS